jgi:hypothetical protein
MMSELWTLQKAGFQLVAGVIRLIDKALHGVVRLGQPSTANTRALTVDVERR